jgi:hypothetical protein
MVGRNYLGLTRPDSSTHNAEIVSLDRIQITLNPEVEFLIISCKGNREASFMQSNPGENESPFPVDPLEVAIKQIDGNFRRRTVLGIIESYNSNYDVIAEAAQNSVDAVEDAMLEGLPGPYIIEVTVNLQENWISFLDTGIGMSTSEVCTVFAPSVSYKHGESARKRDRKSTHRGYKGVGLTFLAYCTEDIAVHSKQAGKLTRGRMRYGRSWCEGCREDPAVIVEDERTSPLDNQSRGSYFRVLQPDAAKEPSQYFG